MIDKTYVNRLLLSFLLASFISSFSEGCIRQNKDVTIQGAVEPNKFSFIKEEKIQYFFDSFINETRETTNGEKQRITVFVDNSKNNVEICVYSMLSFAYTIDRSVFLGAPKMGNDRVVVFCKDSIPSFIDTLYLDYKKGLEYLGEDSLYYMWDSIRPQGDWILLRQDINDEWVLFDCGSIGEHSR